jgi:hypothetical protein
MIQGLFPVALPSAIVVKILRYAIHLDKAMLVDDLDNTNTIVIWAHTSILPSGGGMDGKLSCGKIMCDKEVEWLAYLKPFKILGNNAVRWRCAEHKNLKK